MIVDCPRCGLTNPPDAQRCDCGYDFVSKSVESAHFQQQFPTGIKVALVVIVIWGLVAAFLALSRGDIVPILSIVVWTPAVGILYAMVVFKRYWAFIALIVMTFPIGLVLLSFSREVRLYCLQK